MSKKIKIFTTTLILVLLASTSFFGYKYYNLTKDPQTIAKNEIQQLVKELSKKVMIPENEVPTVATVSDVEALKSQPFFANAANGDKVVVFTSIKKAILYRPDIKKIIEIVPVDTSAANNQQTTPVTKKTETATTTKTDN